ncbi:MAG: AI-2E family transporter [Leptolyngbya foveolarum]|uniref:AI-2E family transporter n=1 Tax=Leptolyngbya foveolarum TaxID=47253 RepID=A0A2W4W272_9CYAN|nr:MAG: AI-2E family transporter [Leptolyngbya foveolarum]
MKFGKIMGAVLLVALLYLLWQIRQVLMLGFAAIAFATVINKLVQRLHKLGVPRALAVTVSLLGLLGLFVGVGWFIGPAIARQLPEYTFLSEQGFSRLQGWYQQIRGVVPGNALGNTKLEDLLPQIAQFSPDWASRLVVFFTGSLDFFLNTLLVIVLTAMLLSNPKAYRKLFLQGFPKFYRRRADSILDECEKGLSGWFIGLLFNMTVITLCSGIGLSLIGVPLPVVNALIAGLLTFIPNIGPVLSVVPPVLMALATAPWMALAVLALYFAIQQIEGMVLTPFVMEKQVSLLPAITLIAQVVFAVFFGLLGLFLALPLVVVLQIWLKELLVTDILNRWPAPRRPKRVG